MLKMALFDCAINEKCCSVEGGFDSSRVPTPGNLPSQAKKMPMPGGKPGDGGAGSRWN